MTEWEGVVDAYDTAAAGNKATWFCIVIPGLTKALYFTGQPSPMGMPAMEVSAVLETTLYITPTGAPQWAAKPTDLESMSLRSSTKKNVEV
nr:MAG TPA: tail tube protein [Caudoviricetes sp.]